MLGMAFVLPDSTKTMVPRSHWPVWLAVTERSRQAAGLGTDFELNNGEIKTLLVPSSTKETAVGAMLLHLTVLWWYQCL